jgi:endonuclease G
MMKKLLLTLTFVLPLFLYGQQKLRDSVFVKTDMFELVYSEKLQQPKFIRYTVQCPNGTAPRKGMDFYVCDSILTSDDKDYVNNPYDKGHLAPAADFNCTSEMLYRTFTYLNCSLQQENLNRTTWRLLEVRERDLAKTQKVVVEIRCVYTPKSIVLPTGATVPDAYYKTIKYGKNTEVYYFKNEKPLTTDYTKYKIK